MDFRQRSDEKEIMDTQKICATDWALFVKDLSWINHYLINRHSFMKSIESIYQKKDHMHVAEFACGDGSTIYRLAQWAKKMNYDLKFSGFDINCAFIEYAQQQQHKHLPIQFSVQDVLSETFRKNKFDIILCNLFCHHLTNEELILFVKQLNQQANVGVMINDLHRHRIAYLGFKIISFLKKFSPMVKHDGLVSIRRGFTKREIISLLEQAGIQNYQVKWCFPFYYHISWSK